MIELGRFLGRLLRPLLKTRLPLMKSVLKPLAKSVLVLLRLATAGSATDAAIQKKCFSSGTTLAFYNEEIHDITRIVKALKLSGLLIKSVCEIAENKVNEQKGGFLGILAATLVASSLANMLAGKRVVRGTDGVIQAKILSKRIYI